MKKKARIEELEKENKKLARDYHISEMSRRLLISGQRAAENEMLMAKIKIERLIGDLESCREEREELHRQIESDGSKLIAAIWREHATETAVYADELRAELDVVVKDRDFLKEVLGMMRSLIA